MPVDDPHEDEVEYELGEIGPNELMVVLQKGSEYQPSERISAALDELANALAAEETADVEGYAFQPTMALDSGFASGEDLSAIGCVRIGCLRGGGGGTQTGCTAEGGKIVVRCKTYNVTVPGA